MMHAVRRGARWCSTTFKEFEWTKDMEADWMERHGMLKCKVERINKQQVLDVFENRTMADKLLEKMVMIDVRGRQEVTATTRLDVDVDQVYVVPYDEIADAMDNLDKTKWYQKYIFPKPRKDDRIILYGADKDDIRPYLAAALLIQKYNHVNVSVYAGGVVDFRGMSYAEWIAVQSKKIVEMKNDAKMERSRLETRRKEELERYRRERARKTNRAQ
eukprot:TRINITY_DN33994_c0_g1_i1.p1 TRINITY_DN33994_c0_g1~~TRINITY_DN33994_c0_g1_i1.p1  ORF type:complete len:216 (+),score=49.14 TRINITY_DN33994_c0_g1_i1:37-684(+)